LGWGLRQECGDDMEVQGDMEICSLQLVVRKAKNVPVPVIRGERGGTVQLPRDIVSLILAKLSFLELAKTALRVCKTWREISIERTVVMDLSDFGYMCTKNWHSIVRVDAIASAVKVFRNSRSFVVCDRYLERDDVGSIPYAVFCGKLGVKIDKRAYYGHNKYPLPPFPEGVARPLEFAFRNCKFHNWGGCGQAEMATAMLCARTYCTSLEIDLKNACGVPSEYILEGLGLSAQGVLVTRLVLDGISNLKANHLAQLLDEYQTSIKEVSAVGTLASRTWEGPVPSNLKLY
jgi:hypothetical protein